MYEDEDIALMHRLRDAFDPQHLANRGKMLGTSTDTQHSRGLHPLERAGVISRV
jgi:glycolate oxidase